MLDIKITSKIFLTSVYVCPPPPPPSFCSNICYLKVCVAKLEIFILNCSLFRIYWGRIVDLFIFIPHLYIHELLPNYPREKFLDQLKLDCTIAPDPRDSRSKEIHRTQHTEKERIDIKKKNWKQTSNGELFVTVVNSYKFLTIIMKSSSLNVPRV